MLIRLLFIEQLNTVIPLPEYPTSLALSAHTKKLLMLRIQHILEIHKVKNAQMIKIPTITKEEYTYIYDEIASFGVSNTEPCVTVL